MNTSRLMTLCAILVIFFFSFSFADEGKNESGQGKDKKDSYTCLLYTSPSPRDS